MEEDRKEPIKYISDSDSANLTNGIEICEWNLSVLEIEAVNLI